MNTTTPLPAAMRSLHWLGVALVLIGYASSEAMEHGSSVVAAWHVLAGAGLLLLAVPRLILHWWHRTHLASAQPGVANRLARAGQWALLAFLIVQPLLGVLAVWAEGNALAVPLTSWAIASPFAGGIGDWPEELHQGIGTLFYAVIAAHAAAAVWHHFVRHDGVLRRML